MPLQKLNSLAESLCLLNMVSWSENEKSRITSLIAEIDSNKLWETWLQMAQLNACESLLYLNISRLQINIPNYIFESLKDVFIEVSNENNLRNQEAKVIFGSLKNQNIPFVILKGQALAENLYSSLEYKKMNDVDFLVQRASLDKLQLLYSELGLICAASIGGENYRKQEKFSHHWPPFFTKTLDCVLGTHWNLATPLSEIQINEEDLWNHVTPFSYLDIPCLRLDDLYFFFHLVVHLAYYKTGLKEFCDPINWYRAKGNNIDYQKFLDLVIKTRSFNPVYRNLYFLNLISSDLKLQKWIDAIKPHVDSFVVSDTEYRGREIYFLIRSRSTQTSRIEKSYALFSLSELFYEKLYFLLKMWKHFLFPRKADVIRMQSLSDNPNLLALTFAYLKTPYLLSRVFAFDLGWSLHLLLMVKHHFDVLKSFCILIASIFTLGKIVPYPKSLSKKIKSLNLPVDSIQQIKTKLE